MAKQDVTVALYYDAGTGAGWQPVPARASQVLAFTRGAAAEGQDSPPGTAAATLDNTSRQYNPLNVTSALYGKVGRYTPLQVSVGGAARSTTEVSSWAPEQNTSGNVAWVAVSAGGVLRRLGAVKTPLRSPLYRANIAASPVLYVPLEDGEQATAASSGLPAGQPLAAYGAPQPGKVPGPVGAGGPAPELATGVTSTTPDATYNGTYRGPVVGSTSTGWAVDGWLRFTGKLDAVSSIQTAIPISWLGSGTLGDRDWRIDIGHEDGVGDFIGYSINSTGTNPSLSSYVTGPIGAWHHFRLVARQNGSDAEWDWYVDGVLVDSDTSVGRTIGEITEMRVGGYGTLGTGSQATDAASISGSNVAVFPTATPSLSAADAYSAGIGWVGETAGRRFLRLGVESGLTTTVVGDPDDTQLMGAQPTDTLVKVLSECARTDMGLMFEPRDALGVAMRTGRDLCNQDPALALRFGDIATGTLAPLVDNRGAYNRVTANRPAGGSAVAVQETGPLSIQDAPDGIGPVEIRVDVNPSTDARLSDLAHAYLARGTVVDPRWPAVVVELTSASPALLAAATAVDIGDLVTIADLPTDWTPDLARLIVVGTQESVPTHARRLGFVGIPAAPFEVGIVGANDGSTGLRGQAVDTDQSSLASGINTTATTLSVASTGGVLWTTNSADWSTSLNGTSPDGYAGLIITIGGEKMRVTNITGASSPQTFTVTRSLNGVVKTHLSGAPVHVAYPARVGL